MLVEVCANSVESALNAEKGGADRIEFCSELEVGGVTPSYGLLKSVRAQLSIPVRVLVRPRSGDFTYSEKEFHSMLDDIELCADLGFDGVVSGLLCEDFSLDVARTEKLVTAAGPLGFTFHRAFDWVPNPTETLLQLNAMGVDYVLTSGQQKTALEGIDLLTQLLHKKTTCIVMPGSGIGVDNAFRFKEKEFRAIHLSGTRMIEHIKGSPKVPMSTGQRIPDGMLLRTNEEVIAKVVASVK